MTFIKTNDSEISIQSVCANGGVCPHATEKDCKQAGYAGASHTYETYVVQQTIGGLDFSKK